MGRRIGEEFEWEVGRRFDSNQNRCRYCIFWSVLLVSADSLRNHNNAKYRCCTCTLILSLHGESISEHYLHHFGQSRDTACRRSTCNSSTTFSRDDIQRKLLCDPTMTRYDKMMWLVSARKRMALWHVQTLANSRSQQTPQRKTSCLC